MSPLRKYYHISADVGEEEIKTSVHLDISVLNTWMVQSLLCYDEAIVDLCLQLSWGSRGAPERTTRRKDCAVQHRM